MQPLLFIFFHCLAAQVSSLNTLNQGDSLNSSSVLVSANNNFTLGFYTPENTNNTYLAVWITSQFPSPLWIGNRDKPVHPNLNPILTLDEAGNLIINHTGGVPVPVYSSGGGRNNVSATLLDSGNFVLSETRGLILWESFDYPTDTLMPGMKLGTNRNLTLSSWFNGSNPATGAFTLEWDPIVGQLLIRRRGVVYWASGRKRDYYEVIGGFRINRFENIAGPDSFYLNYNFTIVSNGEEEYVMYTIRNSFSSGRNRVVGLRLGSDGDIRDTFRLAPVITSSNCYGYKTKQAGCQLWHQPPCRNNRQTFDLRAGGFVDEEDHRSDNSSNLSLSDCRDICWNDCECVAYFLNDGLSHGCEFVIGRNAKFVQNLDGAASASRMYIIVTAPADKGVMKIIIGVLSAIVVLSLGTAFFILRKLQLRKREAALHELLTLDGYTDDNGRGSTNHDLRPFTYSSIQLATHNFSSQYKLGQGGFGPVYKGKTSDGKDIAVKLLSRQSGQGLLEFKTELILISKLQHVNLVKLIGFCVHKDDKMIIYDYMPNKSLDFFLFTTSDEGKLDWKKRFSIIEGIAQGLLYLHKYSRLKIIHRDLKPSNILLDQNMIPKISDFGLARIFKQDINEANTNRRVGTYGYMAPEYAMQGIFSVKSDVYSFGVLVLEIVSGRKNNSFHEIEGPLSLVEYAWELWRKDNVLELMDTTLRDSCVIDQLQRCIHVGLLCVENLVVDRPTIEDVISMLKNEMTNLPMPNSPAFYSRNNAVEKVEQSVLDKISSTNEITLSEIGGR